MIISSLNLSQLAFNTIFERVYFYSAYTNLHKQSNFYIVIFEISKFTFQSSKKGNNRPFYLLLAKIFHNILIY